MAITLTCGWVTPEQKIEFLKHLGTITVDMDSSTNGKFLVLAVQHDKFLSSYIRCTDLHDYWIRVEQTKFVTDVDEAKYFLSGPEGYYI